MLSKETISQALASDALLDLCHRAVAADRGLTEIYSPHFPKAYRKAAMYAMALQEAVRKQRLIERLSDQISYLEMLESRRHAYSEARFKEVYDSASQVLDCIKSEINALNLASLIKI